MSQEVRRTVGALVLGGGALVQAVAAQDAASLQAAREWNQPRGDAGLGACCDVEPIVRTPVEAWRLSFKELYADPVCWGGLVFVAGIQHREPMLYAFDLKTGKSAATSTKLPGAQPGALAVWQGFVAFVQPDGVHILSLRGGQFTTARKTIPLVRPGAPSVLAGQLFVTDCGEEVHCIDLDQGKELGHFSGGSSQPSIAALEGSARALVATVGVGTPRHPDPNKRYVGQYLALETCEVSGLGTPAPQFHVRETRFHAQLAREVREEALASAIALALPPPSATKEPAWMVFSDELLRAEQDRELHAAFFPKLLYDFASPPVVSAGRALGFTPGGNLAWGQADGSFEYLKQAEGEQEKRHLRGATLARGVLYLENWAVRIEDRRVLWELPDLDLARGLWPVADGLALYLSAKKELVCLRDPGGESGADSTAAHKSAAPARKSARPSSPGSGEGVVLRDGTRLSGAVARAADGSVELATGHAEPRHFTSSELALVETKDSVVRCGPEEPVYRAAFAACSLEYRDLLLPQVESYIQAGLVDEARHLTQTLGAFGADAAQLAEYDKRLSGRVARNDRNAAGLHEGGQKEEARLREKGARRFLEAARWCRAHDLPLCASTLFGDVLRVEPATPGVAEEVAPLLPAGAPWRSVPDAAGRWMALARELLPSGARVVDAADPIWKHLDHAPWTQDTIVLRSANIDLVSREQDAHVLGRALQLGERTVEVLTHLLGKANVAQGQLEVRLHRNRDEYLQEQKQELGRSVEWTAGYYSPFENVSHFYVPREGGEAEMRELEHVLAHELAHHFLEARWVGIGRAGPVERFGEPGFWIVEGSAEFVSGQVLEMDRRGERFDDAEVLAVDAAAQVEGARELIPIERLLELDQRGFQKLSDAPLGELKLQHSLGGAALTERTVFYQESAALVFFLLNEAGRAHAGALPSYLRSWYANGLRPQSWQALGYAEASQLAAAFVAFLEQRRKH